MDNLKKIFVVIVTYNRKELLLRNISSILNQSFKEKNILIIDNASTDGTYQFLKENNILENKNIKYKKLPENIGGAGGFYEGIKFALEQGAEWIWMMDDDGYPEEECLEKLYNYAIEHKLHAISPLQINISQHDQLGFPVWVDKKQIRGSISQLDDHFFLQQEANLFNGLLIHRTVIEKIGLPRKEFFIRGDEVEYTKRMKQANIAFGTLVNTKFFHPSDDNERVSSLFGLLTTRDTHSDFKNYYMFRNRAVAFIEDGNSWLLPLDFIRYTYYYLIVKKMDIKGLKLWCRATIDGMKGRLGRHPKY